MFVGSVWFGPDNQTIHYKYLSSHGFVAAISCGVCTESYLCDFEFFSLFVLFCCDPFCDCCGVSKASGKEVLENGSRCCRVDSTARVPPVDVHNEETVVS